MTSNKRCPNFGAEEVHLLITLVREHQDIIECKKSGHLTWNKKDETWKEIANSYNARTGKQFRSVAALKQKYNNLKKGAKEKAAVEKLNTHKKGLTTNSITVTEKNNNHKSSKEDALLLTVIAENSDNASTPINWESVSNVYNTQSEDNEKSPNDLEQQFNVLKKETKKKIAKNKKEFTITGGGEAKLEEITNNDQIIIDMLGTQVHGLPSVLDCDEESVPNVASTIEQNWSTYVPSQLKTPKNKRLSTNCENVSAKRTKFSSKLINEKIAFVQLQREKFLEEHVLKMDILSLKKRLLLKELSEK